MKQSYFSFSGIIASVILTGALMSPTGSIAQTAPSGAPGNQHAGLRPAGVPASFMLTPFGWMSQSCIVMLKKGQTPEAALKARPATADRCIPGRFDTSGAPIKRNTRTSQLAQTDYYKALASVKIPRNFDKVNTVTRVIVPPEPTFVSYPYVYMYTGIHDADDPFGPIVRTAIEWNYNDNRKWTSTIWYQPEDSDVATQTPRVDVKPGDDLTSHIEVTQSGGSAVGHAYIALAGQDKVIQDLTWRAEHFTANSIMNIGLHTQESQRCTYLPAGDVINYPLVQTSLASDGGPIRDISDQITARPAPAVNPCNIVLTMDPAPATAAARRK